MLRRSNCQSACEKGSHVTPPPTSPVGRHLEMVLVFGSLPGTKLPCTTSLYAHHPSWILGRCGCAVRRHKKKHQSRIWSQHGFFKPFPRFFTSPHFNKLPSGDGASEINVRDEFCVEIRSAMLTKLRLKSPRCRLTMKTMRQPQCKYEKSGYFYLWHLHPQMHHLTCFVANQFCIFLRTHYTGFNSKYMFSWTK